MKKICDSESGVLNGRLLLAFSLCSIGAFLGIVSFGQVPTICVNCGGNPNAFLVRSYQGTTRCLDYTPEKVGSPIFINDCKVAHQIVVEEINARHDVLLHAGTKVIGARGGNSVTHTRGGPSGPGNSEFALVLQNPPNQAASHSVRGADQRFALDGDSIILSSSMPEPPTNSNPVLVAKVKNARGAIGTPVVLGPRNLADNELWDFLPTNRIDHDPTSGFVRVSTSFDLATALLNATQGTVIKVDPTVSINVFPSGVSFGNPYGTPITAPGVTIRGDRRGTNLGPELVGPYSLEPVNPDDPVNNLFLSLADYTRITGLRVRGPSRSTNKERPSNGISFGAQSFYCDPPAPGCGYNAPRVYVATIDHNDVSDWPGTAVGFVLPDKINPDCGYPYGVVECRPVSQNLNQTGIVSPTAPFNGLVERNFIHHNERKDLGYGVGVGGRVMVAGNTFLMNRHAIAADGDFQDTYTAWFNLVLSNTPTYNTSSHEQDFDMHGTKDGYGGIAGSEVDIGWNTFLGGNRINFSLRGYPCARDYFHDNVSEQSFVIGSENNDSAIYTFDRDVTKITGGSFPAGFSAPYVTNPYPDVLWVFGNQFARAYTDPTAKLAVGDFDGDGVDDVFLATGRGWYYSPGGVAEWRFLSAKTEKVDQLLFGDFDGDGRTDVVAIRNGYLYVSWGGVSDWELLNSNLIFLPGAIADLAVGDFVGDSRSDIFFANGTNWYVSDGGTGPFNMSATSSFRVKDLRFGDFDGDGKTDVFGVVSGTWSYSKSAQGSWSDGYLRPALTSSVNGVVVADFNGDGFADVAANCDDPGCWRISYGGFQDWYYVSQPYGIVGPHVAGYGHFIGHVEADVLAWNTFVNASFAGACDPDGPFDVLCISVGGIYPLQRQSRQEMR